MYADSGFREAAGAQKFCFNPGAENMEGVGRGGWCKELEARLETFPMSWARIRAAQRHGKKVKVKQKGPRNTGPGGGGGAYQLASNTVRTVHTQVKLRKKKKKANAASKAAGCGYRHGSKHD